MSTTRFAAGDIRFEWDDAKAAANLSKHRVSFEEAATVFLDPLARLFDDPDQRDGELRYLLVGESALRRLVVVVHVDRANVIRLISARLATRRERATMERQG